MQSTLEATPDAPVMNPLPTAPKAWQPPYTKAFSSWPKTGRPAGYYSLPLPDEAAAFYKENGFLVIENCISPEGIAELKEETTQVCRGNRGMIGGITEPQPGESDNDILKRYLCIHFPHKASATMKHYVAHESYVDVLTRIIGPNVKCMQSMLFIKASGKPGQAWHQDEYFIPTRDRSLCGGWLAMDDATVENGCLWILPGSHKRGIIYPHEKHNDRRFDCAGQSEQFPWTDDDSVPVEVKAGSIVFFNGYLLHRSLPNYAKTGYRRVLVNHYMSAESLLPWRYDESVHMGIQDFRDVFMIAGKDPYAFKGTTDVHNLHVRPSGEGGCDSGKKTAPKGEMGSAAKSGEMGGSSGQMGGSQMGGSSSAMGGGGQMGG
jgi:ectoine hydroxylase-related dioxygenase (phytanoyl-CoA dioxygenase family)